MPRRVVNEKKERSMLFVALGLYSAIAHHQGILRDWHKLFGKLSEGYDSDLELGRLELGL